MRVSELFIPTRRDDPADAEVISHKLLMRAGYMRMVTPGIYTFLPLVALHDGRECGRAGKPWSVRALTPDPSAPLV